MDLFGKYNQQWSSTIRHNVEVGGTWRYWDAWILTENHLVLSAIDFVSSIADDYCAKEHCVCPNTASSRGFIK